MKDETHTPAAPPRAALFRGHNTLHDLGVTAARQLQALTARLMQIEREIRDAQPKKSGAIILYLYTHSKRCNGCPHPVWKQWRYHPRNRMHRWVAHALPSSRITQRLPRNPPLPALNALVHEALAIDAKRQALIAAFGALQRASQKAAGRSKRPPEAPRVSGAADAP
ncbi:MAG: hypothetical protein QJR02_02070 [Sinobacteraceae bacterium]|nr:hypothetical protein [Nevskiaceae bacterium]